MTAATASSAPVPLIGKVIAVNADGKLNPYVQIGEVLDNEEIIRARFDIIIYKQTESGAEFAGKLPLTFQAREDRLKEVVKMNKDAVAGTGKGAKKKPCPEPLMRYEREMEANNKERQKIMDKCVALLGWADENIVEEEDERIPELIKNLEEKYAEIRKLDMVFLELFMGRELKLGGAKLKILGAKEREGMMAEIMSSVMMGGDLEAKAKKNDEERQQKVLDAFKNLADQEKTIREERRKSVERQISREIGSSDKHKDCPQAWALRRASWKPENAKLAEVREKMKEERVSVLYKEIKTLDADFKRLYNKITGKGGCLNVAGLCSRMGRCLSIGRSSKLQSKSSRPDRVSPVHADSGLRSTASTNFDNDYAHAHGPPLNTDALKWDYVENGITLSVVRATRSVTSSTKTRFDLQEFKDALKWDYVERRKGNKVSYIFADREMSQKEKAFTEEVEEEVLRMLNEERIPGKSGEKKQEIEEYIDNLGLGVQVGADNSSSSFGNQYAHNEFPFEFSQPSEEIDNQPPSATEKQIPSTSTAIASTPSEALKARIPSSCPAITSTRDAEGLPAGWESAFSEEHERIYYFNRTTEVRQWVKPVAGGIVPSTMSIDNHISITGFDLEEFKLALRLEYVEEKGPAVGEFIEKYNRFISDEHGRFIDSAEEVLRLLQTKREREELIDSLMI